MKHLCHMELWSLIDQSKFGKMHTKWGNRLWTVEKVLPIVKKSSLVREMNGRLFSKRRLTPKDIEALIESNHGENK